LGRSGCGPCIPSSKSSTESFRGFTGDDAGTVMPIGGVRGGIRTGIADAMGGCEGGPIPGSVDTRADAAMGVGVGSVGARPRIAPGVDGSVSWSLVVIRAPQAALLLFTADRRETPRR
jgi:hypothetical protein